MRTPQQDVNLQKAITGLQNLPADYDLLVMKSYANDEQDAAQATPQHPCGTAACVVGHCPSFGIPMAPRDAAIGRWGKYSSEAFGMPYNESDGDWDFCFGAHWPDSVPEAIARLKLYQTYDIPTEWGYDDRFAK